MVGQKNSEFVGITGSPGDYPAKRTQGIKNNSSFNRSQNVYASNLHSKPTFFDHALKNFQYFHNRSNSISTKISPFEKFRNPIFFDRALQETDRRRKKKLELPRHGYDSLGEFPRVQDRRPVGHATRRCCERNGASARILVRVETLFSFAGAGLLRGNLSPAAPAISSSPLLSLSLSLTHTNSHVNGICYSVAAAAKVFLPDHVRSESSTGFRGGV